MARPITARLRVLREVAQRPSATVIQSWDVDASSAWIEIVRSSFARLVADPGGDVLELTPLGETYLSEMELATKPNGGTQ